MQFIFEPLGRAFDGVVDNAENIQIPDTTNYGIYPFYFFIILNIIILRFGFNWPLFSYCYNTKLNFTTMSKEEKWIYDNKEYKEQCMNTIIYNLLYLIVIIISSLLCAVGFYYLVFYFLNPKLVLLRLITGW